VRVELNLPMISNEELATRGDVLEFVAQEARTQTAELASYEQIRYVVVVPREFSVEGGELSPAMKIKRRVVEERYKDAIDHVYAGVEEREHAHA
jgi:long-chain acyl-CoA synthetase